MVPETVEKHWGESSLYSMGPRINEEGRRVRVDGWARVALVTVVSRSCFFFFFFLNLLTCAFGCCLPRGELTGTDARHFLSTHFTFVEVSSHTATLVPLLKFRLLSQQLISPAFHVDRQLYSHI